jgi:glycosyltransferase involved in cell wall biosynthesis
MISVVIPARNAAETLAATLAALIPAAVDGIVRQVIVVDGGSTDNTTDIAELTGADIIDCLGDHRSQLAQGAARARFPWLLFLRDDAVLDDGWQHSVTSFMREVDCGERALSAGVFALRLQDAGWLARLIEGMARPIRNVWGTRDGDHAPLLIPRRLFDEVGGYDGQSPAANVDLTRRLGRRRIVMLDAVATLSAERVRQRGYLFRVLRGSVGRASLPHAAARPDRTA